MSNRPCHSATCNGADRLYIGLHCSTCQTEIKFSPVDVKYQGNVGRRSVLSAEDKRLRKNESRRIRRAAGSAE